MQRHRHYQCAFAKWFTRHSVQQQARDRLRHMRFSLKTENCFAKRLLIQTTRTRSRESMVIAAVATYVRSSGLVDATWEGRSTFPTDRLVANKKSCRLPTLFTSNSEGASLNALLTDHTRLWIQKREERITEKFNVSGEVHNASTE